MTESSNNFHRLKNCNTTLYTHKNASIFQQLILRPTDLVFVQRVWAGRIAVVPARSTARHAYRCRWSARHAHPDRDDEPLAHPSRSHARLAPSATASVWHWPTWHRLGGSQEAPDVEEIITFSVGIKLLTHTLKIWEKVIDRRLRECTEIHESQFGFMSGRRTTDAIFILKQTIGKTPGRPEGHKSHLHRYRESLRSGTEGGDLEMHEGAQRTRKIC